MNILSIFVVQPFQDKLTLKTCIIRNKTFRLIYSRNTLNNLLSPETHFTWKYKNLFKISIKHLLRCIAIELVMSKCNIKNIRSIFNIISEM